MIERNNWTVIRMSDHGMNNIEFLRKFFHNGPDCDNWCLLSTSGIHGSYATLDDLQSEEEEHEKEDKNHITVLIVSPRIVRVHYGHIKIEETDIEWLRELVEKSLKCILLSQFGNMPHRSKLGRYVEEDEE